ncbi:response regulator [Pseudoruegeria sp. SHC-113]|uniref:response regulator n=1 Tax=Pseudoruegeria sp. SHC-113 TaxID=2855439 RepID=UPI0021BB8D73|nr:response regulator [Pseudoruegeria sp. SHC-113]MCT8161377.1 response regulator [Pseudoruegeria sp. SHC-113]
MDRGTAGAEQRLLTVLEEMNVAAFVVPAPEENTQTWLNLPAQRLATALGHTPGPRLLQGDLADGIEDLLKAGTSPGATDWQGFMQAIRTGARFARFELNFPPGRHQLVTFVHAEDGTAALFMSDISELTQFRLQRHRTDKLATLGRLAANYAHDFNNYLAVIDRQLELMSVQEGLSPDLARLLERAQSTTRSAAGRSQELLTFSKPKHDSRKWIRAREIVGRLRASTAFMQSEQLKLHFDTQSPLSVHCDAIFLHSALLNLVINACDACEGAGAVSILAQEARPDEVARWLPDAAPAPRWLKFSVTDTGHGISESDRAHIFDAFYTTKSAHGGSGLGLSIVENFVRMNNGLTYVEDTSPGGTTISMLLPAGLPHAPHERPSPTEDQVPDGFCVLIVEDEFHLAESTRHLLERKGFRVDVARSLDEALSLLQATDACYDVVLSDVVLPDGNGVELCRRSKAMAPDRPVLLISGNIPESLSEMLASCGAEQVLIKPTPIAELAAALLASAPRTRVCPRHPPELGQTGAGPGSGLAQPATATAAGARGAAGQGANGRGRPRRRLGDRRHRFGRLYIGPVWPVRAIRPIRAVGPIVVMHIDRGAIGVVVIAVAVGRADGDAITGGKAEPGHGKKGDGGFAG